MRTKLEYQIWHEPVELISQLQTDIAIGFIDPDISEVGNVSLFLLAAVNHEVYNKIYDIQT